MQVTETDILRLVHDDGIGVGNIQAVLNNGGAQEKVVVAAHKGQHTVFQFLAFHLAVGYANLHIRNQTVKDIFDGR